MQNDFISFLKHHLQNLGIWPWLQQPKIWLYAAAAAGALLGQWGIFTDQWLLGIMLTVTAALLVALAQIPVKFWGESWQSLNTLLMQLEARVKETGKKPLTAPETPGRPQSRTKTAAEPASKTQAGPPAKPVAAPAPDIQIKIPRIWLAGIGIGLLVASQPLLFLEKMALAIVLIVPGVFLAYNGFIGRTKEIILGSLSELQKALTLSLPGLALMLAGNFLLVKFVHQSLWKESLGIVLNLSGVLLLLKLFPRVLPDPEAEPAITNVLNAPSGAADNRRAIIVKIVLAGLGLLGLKLSGDFYIDGNYTASLGVAVVGLGLLFLSFPWARARHEEQPVAPTLMAGVIKYWRLALLTLAIYLGYLGQKDFTREMLNPALMHFILAGVALVLALREPPVEGPDLLKEKPLHWAWEVLGMLAILTVAFWWRSRLIDTIPYGIECDEAGGTNNALDIAANLNSLTAHPIGAPLFLLLPRVVSTYFFGIGNLGVKADAIFFGVLGVLVIYIMARRLWGPRAGMGVAALMALSRWHLHFSRFGFNNAFFIVLLMLGFYFLMKGLTSRRKWNFVYSGIGFALALQTETAGRLVPILCLGLLAFLLVSQRHFFQRNWRPLTVMLLGVWMAGASIGIYFAKNTNVLFRRVQEVSIYSADANAPTNPARGFIDSARISLTQLNWHGDTRTRHNGGMTGEPMLDFWTAILFGLGLLYSLYHWRRWRYGILLIWFFGFMSASVFSIEAPQSHRAFGILPAVFLLIGALLDRARRLLQETLGRPGVLAGCAGFLLVLVPVYQTNFHKYFDTVPAFDTNCTAVARYVGKFSPQEWETMLMTAYFWHGHPPFLLYARNMSGRFYTAPSDVLPYRLKPGKNVTYPLVLEYPQIFSSIQWFYPQGRMVEEVHEKYGLAFKAWEVRKEEVDKTRGLKGRYWNNPDWAGAPALERTDQDISLVWDKTQWPLKGPGSVEWEGTIWIPHLGNYTFYAYAADWMEVTIGRNSTLQAAGRQESAKTVRLAEGLNRIRVRARHAGTDNRIRLSWSSTESVEYYIHEAPQKDAFPKQLFPSLYYLTYKEPRGLLETYYFTANWSDAPMRERIQPVIYYWSGFGDECRSVTWSGWIQVTEPGEYRFQMDGNEYADISIDDTLVFQRGTLPKDANALGTPRPTITLSAGRHRIFARWSAGGGGYKLWWTKPNQEQEIIPTWALIPVER